MKGVCALCQTPVAVEHRRSANEIADEMDERLDAEDRASAYRVAPHTILGKSFGPNCDGAGTAPDTLVRS